MTKNINYVSHKKSKVKTNDGKPQLPSAGSLVEGEIAINYAEDVETLSIKNESGTVVTFSSDNYYTEQKLGSGFTGENSGVTVTQYLKDNEYVIAQSLNDLEANKLSINDFNTYSGAVNTTIGNKASQSDLNTLSGTVTAHTASTSVHMTSTEKTNVDSLATNIAAISGITSTKIGNWDSAATNSHTHSNKSALDAITGNVGTMAYANTSSYSSATEVNTALNGKVNAIEYSTFSAATNTSINDLSGQSETVAAALVELNDNLVELNDNKIDVGTFRRTRKLWDKETFISTLKRAVADQDLEKYGMRVGDYCSVTHTIGGSSKTFNYVIAGLNTMKGTHSYRLTTNHVGIIVDTNCTQAWNISGNTYQSTNTYSTDGTWTTGSSAAGYANCDLHYYLTNTILPNVKSDLGSDNIKKHYKLYSTAVNTSGYNRFGSAGGCSSSWAWYANQEICALSEIQVYGSIVWSSSGYDTGEACRQLDVFRVYNMNEIFEGRHPWLRDVASASNACDVNDLGHARDANATLTYYVAALILFA